MSSALDDGDDLRIEKPEATLYHRTTLADWREVERTNAIAKTMLAAKSYAETLSRPPLNSMLITGCACAEPIVSRIVDKTLKRLTQRLPRGLVATPARIGPADRVTALEAALRTPEYVPVHLHGDQWITNARAGELLRASIPIGRVVIITTPEPLDVIHGAASKVGQKRISDLLKAIQQSFDLDADRLTEWEYACFTGLFGKLFDQAWPLEVTDAAYAVFTRDIRKLREVSPLVLRQIAEIALRFQARPHLFKASIHGFQTVDAADYNDNPAPSLRLFAKDVAPIVQAPPAPKPEPSPQPKSAPEPKPTTSKPRAARAHAAKKPQGSTKARVEEPAPRVVPPALSDRIKEAVWRAMTYFDPVPQHAVVLESAFSDPVSVARSHRCGSGELETDIALLRDGRDRNKAVEAIESALKALEAEGRVIFNEANSPRDVNFFSVSQAS